MADDRDMSGMPAGTVFNVAGTRVGVHVLPRPTLVHPRPPQSSVIPSTTTVSEVRERAAR